MPAPKNGIKKHGAAAPKGKGQIRAKSGCYTCRIRRKKCDEERHPDNRCGACTRLNIQCLGFGPKRPDWLKEKQPLIIQRIKEHLAGNGKMKNQASGGRSTMEAPYLHLLDDDESETSYESPSYQSTLPMFESPPAPNATLPQSNLYTLDTTSLDIDAYHDPAVVTPFEVYTNSSHASTSTIEPLAVSRRPSSYNFNYATLDDGLEMYQQLGYYSLVPGGNSDYLVAHYINEVSGKQWLLVEQSALPQAILTAVNDPQGFAREAARLLASIHFQRRSRGDIPSLQERSIRLKYDNLRTLLLQKSGGNYPANVRGNHLQKYSNLTADDASGILLVISSFLFDGGQGEWNMWLSVACGYARMLLASYPSPIQALVMCSAQDRFSIKAAIWFDVLAAITTQKPPNLMHEINHLFHPGASGFGITPELDMLDSMGCESHVVWALAKTIELATWKTQHQASGTLSILELVRLSNEIEACLNEHRLSPPMLSSPMSTHDEIAQKRYFCSEMFRTSTILFLRSVVSGDYPNVPEISAAVHDMLTLLKNMRKNLPQHIRTAVIRMTVSSLFIFGALTNEEHERLRLKDLLEEEGAVGNCSTLSRVLNNVWAHPTSPVPWRNILKEENMLLV